MMIHVNHAVRVKNVWKVIVPYSYTDVFVNLVYHFTRWIYADLEQLWLISGHKESESAIAVHALGERLDDSITEILPVFNAVTG